jgi:polynucleotide 5'-hydroxyl-kinase GRC3/NOL9
MGRKKRRQSGEGGSAPAQGNSRAKEGGDERERATVRSTTSSLVDGIEDTIELKEQEEISIEGIARVRVLEGCLSVQGYLLSAGKGSITCYGNGSLGWPLKCHPVFSGEYRGPEHPERCLVFLDDVHEDKSSGIRYSAESTATCSSTPGGESDPSSAAVALKCKTFQYEVDAVDREHGNQYELWDRSLSVISEEVSESSRTLGSLSELTALVCGPKNVGKSTFCRRMVNKLLNSNSVVAYLEADCGQPEFTPPGSVSLTLIDTAISGPPFMHPRKATQSCFIGDTTPKNDPVLYFNSVLHLLDWYVEHGVEALQRMQPPGSGSIDHLVPLVINTQGWVKGLGFDILDRLVQHIKPRHVVQLCTNTPKDLPKDDSWKASAGSLVYYLQGHSFSAPSSMSALDTRSLAWLSFCHQCMDSSRLNLRDSVQDLFSKAASSLCSCYPFKVNLRSLRVVSIANYDLPESFLPNVLNGALVALATDKSVVSNSNGNFVPPPPSCYPFIGFGLVRSVDAKTGDLYILTNIPGASVEEAGLLVLGSLSLPQQLLQNADFQSPYLAHGTITVEGTGAGLIKGRNNMKRGRLGK